MTELPMRLSNSKIKTWRRCPKKYHFKYELGLKPRKKGIQLERGSWLHDLLMHHYDGKDWKARHIELSRTFYNLFEEEREHLGDMPKECARIMMSYLLHYREEDKGQRTIDSELDEIITLPNGLEFNFIIDRIYEDRDGLWLKDYKTLGKFMDADFMLLDAQLTRYFWCAEKMGYTPLMGIEFDEIRTKAPWVPTPLARGGLSKKAKMDTDYFTYLRALKRHELDPNDYRDVLKRLKAQSGRFFRKTRMPKDRVVTQQMMQEMVMSAREIRRAERTEEFPRTPDKACTWDCEFINPCIMQLQGGDISTMLKQNFTTRKREED